MKIIRGKHFSEPPVVRATCGGVPVYAFGYTHIPATPPNLMADSPFQAGNQRPTSKLALKNSDAIASNYIGCATTRFPRISENDELPVECVHLIDGDPQSCWMSKTQPRSDMNPVWIRVDFPTEHECTRIVLRKRPLNPRRILENAWGPEDGAAEVGRGIPGRLTVRVTRDNCHWTTIFDGETRDDETRETFELVGDFGPVRALHIIGGKLPKVENLMFCFSIANVEVYDERGENVALLTRGAGVGVNSTTHSQGQEMEIQRTLFPVHYDLGAKWARVGYHDDVLNWHWVERKKGELKIDPYADAAITELRDNGVETLLCLDYGNRLYTQRPGREMPQLWEWNYEPPLPPKTPEALAAWERYCRFMVRHFKDRVRYFEIWNEWNGGGYWGDTPDVNHYLILADIAIRAVREEAPEAKIVLGSYAGFLWGISEWSQEELDRRAATDPFMIAIRALARRVDVIGYHPFYNTDPDSDRWRTYAKDIPAFDAYCQAQGFQGAYTVSEYNYGNCVPPYEGQMWWGSFSCTELGKAKYIARIIALHTRHRISSLFCETFSSTHPLDLSLFRRTFTQDPVDAQQPQAAYYVMRNLCSYLDGAEPAMEAITLSPVEKPVTAVCLARGEERLFAAWLEGRCEESCDGQPVAVTLEGEYSALTGFDPVNGAEQALEFTTDAGQTRISGWLLKDYPMFIRARR